MFKQKLINLNFNSLMKVIFIFLLLPTFSFCSLSISDRKSRRVDKKAKNAIDFSDEMFTSGLIGNSSVDYKSIIQEHKSFSVIQAMVRYFPNDILGYVTPWNAHGYDVAKLFPSKFTMISPVWLQIKPRLSDGAVVVEGMHDIDREWVKSVRLLNKKIKMVPRIIFEQWTYEYLKKLFETKAVIEEFSSRLIKLAKDKKFNGYVVEIWNMLGGHLRREVTQFLIDVSNAFKEHKLALILVIPPPVHAGRQRGIFGREDFENLVHHVTAFSLMTYDYSSSQRPGPNSPLPWLVQCVEELTSGVSFDDRKKLLLGLNFYGYDYSKVSSKPIIGHEYISLLEKHKPKFIFNNATGEHSFAYKSEKVDHLVFYPTLYSIHLRLQLARDLNTGISIWEIGQGLDYFYEIL